MKPSPTVAIRVTVATTAARIRPTTNRKTMKIIGVSLIPATMPMPMPASLHRLGARMSVTTTARINRLICPN
ncbi:Uncharacterised protein [Mycobacteroides abscessus subsp. abscessus]|nr:Uncharacterised protein [Mycobacteroides abscessus subsp. abscessus]